MRHVSANGAHRGGYCGRSYRAAPHETGEDARGNEEGQAPVLGPQELAGAMQATPRFHKAAYGENRQGNRVLARGSAA